MDEFDRQISMMVHLGLPELIGSTRPEFERSLEQLRSEVAQLPEVASAEDDRQPFLLMPSLAGASQDSFSAASLVPLMRLVGSELPGIVDRNHGEQGLTPFAPLPELGIEPDAAYLLIDIDRGDRYRGIRPNAAVADLASQGRTPLTITEGILLQLVRPELLQPNRCFMLAGSRRGDKRVPALWISNRAPKLGWCWEGNPHSWLGTASAAGRRVGAPVGVP